MKKKLITCGMMLQASSTLFAQNSRGDINTMISSWLIPVVGLCLIGGFIFVVVQNFDGLRGKNGANKAEAWWAVGEGIIFVVLGVGAITFVASKLAGMNFSI